MSDALVVIDVQQALVDYLEPARAAELTGVLNAVLARARGEGVPVVYVRHGDDELVPGTPGWDVARQIAPRPGEPIVEKRFRDAFRETDLADVLGRLAADHLILCGMQTEYCVDATMREAERRGYRVTLVADGHATYDVPGMSEAQIRDHVHRVADGSTATVTASDALTFHAPATRTPESV